MEILRCKLGKYKQGSKFVYFKYSYKGQIGERKVSTKLMKKLLSQNLLYSGAEFTIYFKDSDYEVKPQNTQKESLVNSYEKLLEEFKNDLSEEQYLLFLNDLKETK